MGKKKNKRKMNVDADNREVNREKYLREGKKE